MFIVGEFGRKVRALPLFSWVSHLRAQNRVYISSNCRFIYPTFILSFIKPTDCRNDMPMMLLRISSGVLLVVWLALIGLVHCNVEKTIFIATHAKNIESWLSDIELPRLSPNNPTIRARLPVTAPNDTVKADIVHWFLLDDLEAGTRYEVRICWPATVISLFLHFILIIHSFSKATYGLEV